MRTYKINLDAAFKYLPDYINSNTAKLFDVIDGFSLQQAFTESVVSFDVELEDNNASFNDVIEKFFDTFNKKSFEKKINNLYQNQLDYIKKIFNSLQVNDFVMTVYGIPINYNKELYKAVNLVFKYEVQIKGYQAFKKHKLLNLGRVADVKDVWEFVYQNYPQSYFENYPAVKDTVDRIIKLHN